MLSCWYPPVSMVVDGQHWSSWGGPATAPRPRDGPEIRSAAPADAGAPAPPAGRARAALAAGGTARARRGTASGGWFIAKSTRGADLLFRPYDWCPGP